MALRPSVLGIEPVDVPEADVVLGPICKYRVQHVYRWFHRNGFCVQELQGPSAIKPTVEREAQKKQVTYITGAGHGAFTAYEGFGGQIVFEVGNYNEKDVKGKIIHLVCCAAARQLGVDFVRNCCLAFFGYDGAYAWHPFCPKAFFESDSEIDKAFAEHLTAGQVYKRVKRLHERWIVRLQMMASNEADAAIGMLKRNLRLLRCPSAGGIMWGHEQARLR